MHRRNRAARRVGVAFGIACLHAAVAWLLVHEHLVYARAAPPFATEVYLLQPLPIRSPPRQASPAQRPQAPPVSQPSATPPPASPLPAATPSPSFALTGSLVANAYGEKVAKAESRRGFGFPTSPDNASRPPSVFDEPSPRVGTTERTPEGEQIIWLTSNCYASVGSTSLTLRDVHAFHRMMPMICTLRGPAQARGDLFASLKRPDPPTSTAPAPADVTQPPVTSR